jgi:hypothetical protein
MHEPRQDQKSCGRAVGSGGANFKGPPRPTYRLLGKDSGADLPGTMTVTMISDCWTHE